MTRIVNQFLTEWVGARYDASRPDIHSQVIAHLNQIVTPTYLMARDQATRQGELF